MRYLIAGAGPAGVIAAEHLRQYDPTGEIVLIGAEDEPPYSRMAIPYFLVGKVAENGTHLRHEADHYQNKNIQFLRNTCLTALDTAAKQVTLDNGQTLPYDRLLVATGSHPVLPPIPGMDLPGVMPCWTLEQAREINRRAVEGSKVVLIGAGFIGSIVLDALGDRKTDLTVVESQTHMVPRMMNLTGGNLIKQWCEAKGVRVLTSTTVEKIVPGKNGRLMVHLTGGEILEAELVITAAGVAPNMDFLAGTGIACDQGILVDAQLRTSNPDVFAAGDVAQGPDFSLVQGTSVHAIQPTAAEHAQIAAANMAGSETVYRGSLAMNVVETLGLPHYTFGQWMGVEGGDHAEVLDEANFKYIRLEFDGEVLVGAIHIGHFEQVGILRGLIQSRIPLGDWKAVVMKSPKKIMEAYLAVTDSGRTPPRMKASPD